MKALTVRVPDELDVRFTEFCRKRGHKKGGFILSLLERVLDQYEKQSSLETAAGVSIYRPIDRDPLTGLSKLLGKSL